MTLQQTFNNATGQNQALVQDGEYTAESVNGPREALTKDTKLKLSQIKREAVTDKTYKIGEISQKTGLQKQPDGSWAEPRNKEIGKTGNFEKKQQEAKKAKAAEALKQQRAEGEANAAAFQKKVESGEIKYNKETGQFEETGKKAANGKNIGLNKQAAIAMAQKSGSSAFLMKNSDGEYAVVNSAEEFNQAEKMGYESANEELHPHQQTTAVRRDSASPEGVMSEISNGIYNAKHPEDFESDMASMGYETLEFNDEYAVVQNNKGSQFQIRFTDHGDGRDFAARSMNLVYQDEDDDTDYDEDE